MKNLCPIKKIIKRDGSIVKYDCGRIATAIFKAAASTGHPNRKLSEDMARKVEGALVGAYGPDAVPSLEDIQDIVENVLMENRLTGIARNYIIYRHQRAMARAARSYEFEVSDNVPYKTIYEVLRWNMERGCDSVQSLNGIIAGGTFPDLVKEADKRYADEINRAAARIAENAKTVRLVIVAGPSSSGKTTTTLKLSESLGAAGIGLKAINIDNYFFDLPKHPIDEFGDHDYETPEALDVELINEHLALLLNGRTIKTPHYDFKTGVRTLNVHELRLEENELLLIDSLHGLHSDMTRQIPDRNKFRFYVETLGQFRTEDGAFMRWSDNRLLRRMIRDKDHRNLKPMETLTHWHYVRRSEVKNIIPFVARADFILNSALPYELPVLKHKLFRHIAGAINAYGDDPRRMDAHIRANRIHELLKPVKAIADDACIPSDSLLREFIGGSKYKY